MKEFSRPVYAKMRRNEFLNARRKTLEVVTWWTLESGRKVVRGPISKVRVGMVNVRQWGSDAPVEIESLGTSFNKDGVQLVYGYPKGETPGQG